MDKIPFEEQRVIHALVVFRRTRNMRPGLVRPYPELLRLIDKCSTGISFFQQVYHDLCSDRHTKYASFTESEFKQFLEAEYLQPVQVFVAPQDQTTAEERKEYERRARADFDANRKGDGESDYSYRTCRIRSETSRLGTVYWR